MIMACTLKQKYMKLTIYHNNEVPRRDTNYMCLSVIRIQSVYFKLEEHRYCSLAFLDVCRYGADNRDL